jgi:hypothetical protein
MTQVAVETAEKSHDARNPGGFNRSYTNKTRRRGLKIRIEIIICPRRRTSFV